MSCCSKPSTGIQSANSGSAVNTCCNQNTITAAGQTISQIRTYIQNASNVGSCIFSAAERSALQGFMDSVREFMALEEITGVTDPGFPAFFMRVMHTVHLKPEFEEAIPYFVNARQPMTPDTRPDAATILADHAVDYANGLLFFGLMHNRRRHGTNGVALEFVFSHDYSRYSDIGTTSPILDATAKISTGTGNLCNNTLVLLSEPAYLLNGNLRGLNSANMDFDPCRDFDGPTVVPAGAYIARSVKENAFNSFNTTGDELLYGRITLLNVGNDNWVQAMIASRIGLIDDQRWKYTLPTDFFDRCGLEDRSMAVGNVARKAGYLFNPDNIMSSAGSGGSGSGGSCSVGGSSGSTWSVPARPVTGHSFGYGAAGDSDDEDFGVDGDHCGCRHPCSCDKRPTESAGARELHSLNVRLAGETLPERFLGDNPHGNSCIEIDKRVPRQGTILGLLGYQATALQRLDAKINHLYLKSKGKSC